MYEYLEGRVAERGPARLVLDVGGVGFELCVPLGSSFEPAPGPAPGPVKGPVKGPERVRAFVHFVVRDDAHQLFGFPDRDSRELFRLLLRAKGVGPGLALTVLSGLTRLELLEAVAAGDVAPLVRIKGLGRKRAEQILLDLGEKATALLAQMRAGAARDTLEPLPPPGASENIEDAISALVSIGFSERDAKKSVDAAADEVDPSDLEVLVRTALRK